MTKKTLFWEILHTGKSNDIIKILLDNRGLRTSLQKEEFLKPQHPLRISLKDVKIEEKQVSKSIARIKKAISNGQRILIYGDYDTDGICATAILWESLYDLTDKVTPYIPDRFSEGYGLSAKAIKKLKDEYPDLSLIITVDNGIVANDAVESANELNIDVIITDHHQKEKDLPSAYSIIHTDLISGSGISWFLSREIAKNFNDEVSKTDNGLELAGIGTISDQLTLIGVNRSIAKYGLESLNSTKRVGLKALFEEAGVKSGSLGTYEVNFVIAPRINAMGRLKHAIDSLRLICTKDRSRANDLANYLGRTNRERQKVVDEVVLHAKEITKKRKWKGAIVLAHESYHEGVIGLAASKIVEEFWRPTIVISKGKKISKASARSIPGFNIIENVRSLESLIISGGGHPMAAGFSIKTSEIDAFTAAFERISKPKLNEKVLSRSLKVDMKLEFSQIDMILLNELTQFEPGGIGNATPCFVTFDVKVLDSKIVGQEGKHLKLLLQKGGKKFSSIAFGLGSKTVITSPGNTIDIVYSVSADNWMGNDNIQLKLRDLKARTK